MKRGDSRATVLALAGTVLATLPLLAPVATANWHGVFDGRFRLDWLMPLELYPLVLVGGGLLLWVSWRTHIHRGWVAWSLGASAALVASVMVWAQVSGLAAGTTAAVGVPLAIGEALVGACAITMASVVVAGVFVSRALLASVGDSGMRSKPGG